MHEFLPEGPSPELLHEAPKRVRGLNRLCVISGGLTFMQQSKGNTKLLATFRDY